MANPTVQRARVGVQEVKYYPHNDAAGPYDNTTECKLLGLQELGISMSITTAKVTGGEHVHLIDAFETGREITIRISAAKSDLRILALLLGENFTNQEAEDEFGEIQYRAASLEARAPYGRLFAKSTNGNGEDRYTWARVKVEGDISYNLQMGQVTNLDFTVVATWDPTFARQDGEVGGIGEHVFASKGAAAIHS